MTQRRKPAAKKAPPRIKNYLSEMEVSISLEIIRASLVSHGAKRVLSDYDDSGQIVSISFEILLNGKRLAFTLPNRFERIMPKVADAWKSIGKNLSNDALREQALKTSWANIKDWVLAQMALIDSETVEAAEVFFPYLLNEGEQTAYETFKQRQLLPGNVTEGHYRIEETKDGGR